MALHSTNLSSWPGQKSQLFPLNHGLTPLNQSVSVADSVRQGSQALWTGGRVADSKPGFWIPMCGVTSWVCLTGRRETSWVSVTSLVECYVFCQLLKFREQCVICYIYMGVVKAYLRPASTELCLCFYFNAQFAPLF